MGLVNRVLARQTVQSDWQESVRFVADGDALQGGIGFTRTGDTYEADGVGVMPAQDGVTPVARNRFVLDFAAPDIDSGILEVVDVGSGGTTYKWKRAAGLDSTIDPSKPAGMTVRVEEGSTFAGVVVKVSTTGDISINTDSLDFEADAAAAASTLQAAYEAGEVITVDIPGQGTFLVQNTAAAGGAVMKLSQLSGAGLGGELLTVEMGAAQTAGIAAFINDLSDYSNPANSAIALRVRAGSPLQNALRVGTTFEIDAAGTGVQVSLDSQATLLLYSDIAIRIGRTAAAGGAYTVPQLAIGEEFTLPAAKGAAGTVMTDVAGNGVLSMQPPTGGGPATGDTTTSGDVTSVIGSYDTGADDTASVLRVRTLGIEDSNANVNHYEHRVVIKKNGAAITVEQVDLLSLYEGAGVPSADGVTFVINGNAIDITVRGLVALDMQWTFEVENMTKTLSGG